MSLQKKKQFTRSKHETAIIIGAGPAGLTAAHELLIKTDIKPIIFESNSLVGGISKTINYKGNRIDIGGHRFFSKSKKINDWWLSFLPLSSIDNLCVADDVMLLRNRLSRIYFLGKFFDYPVSLSFATCKNLGSVRIFKVVISYLKSKFFPIRPESSLADFFINRFGKELYLTFFKDYTEKVWGCSCQELSADWGVQRARKLSIFKTLIHAVKRKLGFNNIKTEISLIDQFFYPKLGPGQLWELVTKEVVRLGGKIYKESEVVGVNSAEHQIKSVIVKKDGGLEVLECDYLFSSMPIKDLIAAFNSLVPSSVVRIAEDLKYRDFIIVGLLLKKMPEEFLDNWIYIQDHKVKLGRVQLFNNWSPYLVKDKNTVWLGLEYFCFEGDEFWRLTDDEIIKLALAEFKQVFEVDDGDFLDGVVVKVPKAYPIYIGAYNNFEIVRNYLDQYSNLFLIGRNGMHRYNNMDHSMLTAMKAVDNIIHGVTNKSNIWQVNSESEYHEEE